MRLRIVHETAYRYREPANRAIQILRLTPRGHDGQFVVNWRIEVDHDCRLDATTDPFGNVIHSFTAEGPLDGLVITADGVIETQDARASSPARSNGSRLRVFLRDTAAHRIRRGHPRLRLPTSQRPPTPIGSPSSTA